MNKHLLTAALAVSLFTSVHAQTAAAAGPLANLTVSSAFDYESQYTFRGKKVTNSAFQPSVNFAYALPDGSTAKAYIWTSQPISRGAQGGTIGNLIGPNFNNEIDLGAYWDKAIPGVDSLTGEVGVQMYWYPDIGGVSNVASRSYEFHAGLMYDTTKSLNGYNINPTVMVYHDVILDSNTLTGSLAYSWDLSDAVGVKGLSLNPLATLGWTGINRVAGDQLNPGLNNWGNSYTYWQLDLELDYKLNTTTTFYLGGHYAGNNDGNAGAGGFTTSGSPQFPGSDNSLWLSLGVKFNF